MGRGVIGSDGGVGFHVIKRILPVEDIAWIKLGPIKIGPRSSLIFGLISLLAGTFLLSFAVYFTFFRYSKIEATCVGNQPSAEYYSAIYNYTVDGVNYSNVSKQSWENPEVIGSVVEIYYLRSNPNEIFEERNNTILPMVIVFISGFIFVVVGISLLIICALLFKKKKSYEDLNYA